jgi:hypothetical protein
MRILVATTAVLIASSLAGCATNTPVEPKLVHDTVFVDRPVPCSPTIPARPAYADSDDALRASKGDLLEQVRLLLTGRQERQGRETVLEAALGVCTAPVAPAPAPR